MNNFRENDILILVGAGCSKEAGIPTSIDMIKEIEGFIKNDKCWQEYKDIYYFIKSCILYADGLQGKYDEPLNIERLVNTLNELEKKEEHPIFPFIGSWNSKVVELCGNDFKKITNFKIEILKQLKKWVTLNNYSEAIYYKYFTEFAKQIEFPLRIFSLNYDLCLEKNNQDTIIELGFDEQRKWQWQRFEKNENVNVNIYLYKMHGSINWRRDTNGFLTYSDEVNQVDNPDLIFGTNYKLQYVDPYLFYAYEFRKYSLEANLIITIGYGFFDEHINGIISQALRSNNDTKLIANLYKENVDKNSIRDDIKTRLNINNERLIIMNKKASEFLKNDLNINELNKYTPKKTAFDS
ncbi:MAG TPA: SIR2 family protein [Bacteroidia bacterium]|nr:SIR2 family protein [Bacteroidia bacterium]HRS59352.1 SIR2 family protein [Bacteroidia bacterium]